MSLRASRRSAGRPTNRGGQKGDCLSWSCPAVNVTLLKRAPPSLSPRRPPSHLSCRLLVNSSPANRMETSTLGNEPVQEGEIESGAGQWQTMASCFTVWPTGRGGRRGSACLHVDLVHFQPNCSPRVRDDEFGPVELSRPLHGASLRQPDL